MVAAAITTRDGTLREANPGFMRCVQRKTANSGPLDVRDVVVEPRLDRLAARKTTTADGVLYRGIVIVKDPEPHAPSLHGTIYEFGGDLLIIAEPEFVRFETNAPAANNINEELAAARQEISRLERVLEYQEAFVEGAIADREALLDILSKNVGGLSEENAATAPKESRNPERPTHVLREKWEKDINTGILELNVEHMGLIDRYRAMASSLHAEAILQTFTTRLREFIDAAFEHFAHEEQIMRNISFPDYAEHKKEHDRLIKDLDDLLAIMRGEVPLSECESIVKFLRQWFMKHTRDQDMKIHSFITK